ncbi:uncharacterized protein RAG0_01072 [Rhynchosporium agropyri]|uniref:Uncharacterized protein n=1 Tax=Rhynchosporium agropyri TaxID=914238 RepID=A0A1E1JVI5_9HELO|nr:uncharacterized protein RAG0_01072 [Rhynchosporium agropyri]
MSNCPSSAAISEHVQRFLVIPGSTTDILLSFPEHSGNNQQLVFLDGEAEPRMLVHPDHMQSPSDRPSVVKPQPIQENDKLDTCMPDIQNLVISNKGMRASSAKSYPIFERRENQIPQTPLFNEPKF